MMMKLLLRLDHWKNYPLFNTNFLCFFEIILCWKKCLFSKVGFVAFPCLGLQFCKKKNLSLQLEEEWKT